MQFAVLHCRVQCAMCSNALQCIPGTAGQDVAVIDADQCQEKMVAAT